MHLFFPRGGELWRGGTSLPDQLTIPGEHSANEGNEKPVVVPELARLADALPPRI